jgi:hypothetical protein
MRFIVEFGNPIEQRFLTYVQEDCSFDTEPITRQVDFELVLNKINLSVVDNRVIQLWGFCGLNKSMKSGYQVPQYAKGSLRIEHNLKYGFAYGINDNDDYEYPVYVNAQTGWVCIGDPIKKGNAVEFINNCVAVIDDSKEFVSLWLKPEKLPFLCDSYTLLQ